MVVLTSDADVLKLSYRRYGRLKHLAVHVRSLGHDRALAAGVSPDSRPDLCLRARMLLGNRFRRRLAGELRGVIKRAQQPRSVFDPTVPLARSAILANREAMAELACWLEHTEPADVRGIAQVRLLLCDGASPLYSPANSAELEDALEQISDALDPFQALPV